MTAFAQMSPPQATTQWLCLGLYRPWGIGLLSSSTEACRLSVWARSCQASGMEKFVGSCFHLTWNPLVLEALVKLAPRSCLSEGLAILKKISTQSCSACVGYWHQMRHPSLCFSVSWPEFFSWIAIRIAASTPLGYIF